MIALSSNEPLTKRLDLGEKATLSTGAVCALSWRKGGGCRTEEGAGRNGLTLIVPSSDAVATYSESGEMVKSLIPDSPCQYWLVWAVKRQWLTSSVGS